MENQSSSGSLVEDQADSKYAQDQSDLILFVMTSQPIRIETFSNSGNSKDEENTQILVNESLSITASISEVKYALCRIYRRYSGQLDFFSLYFSSHCVSQEQPRVTGENYFKY